MHRRELARRTTEMEGLQPEVEAKVLQYLREHPEDVFTVSNLREALYPEWGKLSDHDRDPKVMAMINALRALENSFFVEALGDCSGQTYYGLA